MARARDLPPTVIMYRALIDLAYPTDADIIDRLVAGEDVPWEDRSIKQVGAGELVSDIPTVSLPWLLEQGLVEPVVEAENAVNRNTPSKVATSQEEALVSPGDGSLGGWETDGGLVP